MNSLEESGSWAGSPYRTRPNSSRNTTPQKVLSPHRVAGTAKIYSTSPEKGVTMFGAEGSKDRFDETEAEETAEESEILDDIFFLK